MCWEFMKRKGRTTTSKEAPKQNQNHLTDEELKAVFKKHDNNHDGHLDKSELTEAFKELGCLLPGYRASQAIHQNDIDLDGDIDEHEIDHLISHVRTLGI